MKCFIKIKQSHLEEYGWSAVDEFSCHKIELSTNPKYHLDLIYITPPIKIGVMRTNGVENTSSFASARLGEIIFQSQDDEEHFIKLIQIKNIIQ